MPKLWITYSWDDNATQDIDFVEQELTKAGVTVRRDIWTAQAGTRLWDQIEKFICSPAESDAWAMVVTQNSVGSEPCREEFAYALDRALESRGAFPIIGLFLDRFQQELLPKALSTRLCVTTKDEHWIERMVAAVEGKALDLNRPKIDPYYVKIHRVDPRRKANFAIEVRPRVGSWFPFLAAIPVAEKDRVQMKLLHGPKDHVPNVSITVINGPVEQKGQWCLLASNECTATQSFYALCQELPTQFRFGQNGLGRQFVIPIVNGIVGEGIAD